MATREWFSFLSVSRGRECTAGTGRASGLRGRAARRPEMPPTPPPSSAHSPHETARKRAARGSIPLCAGLRGKDDSLAYRRGAKSPSVSEMKVLGPRGGRGRCVLVAADSFRGWKVLNEYLARGFGKRKEEAVAHQCLQGRRPPQHCLNLMGCAASLAPCKSRGPSRGQGSS